VLVLGNRMLHTNPPFLRSNLDCSQVIKIISLIKREHYKAVSGS
jgi:hypothetical protein